MNKYAYKEKFDGILMINFFESVLKIYLYFI
jgi:hypothetical protein